MNAAPGESRLSCRLLRPEVLREAAAGAGGRESLADQVRFLGAVAARRIPYVTDEYSRLRYAVAMVETLALPVSGSPPRQAGHPLELWMLRELHCLARLRAGEAPAALLAGCTDALELGAALRALMHSGAVAPLVPLLEAAGRSELTDALLRDLVVLRARRWEAEELAASLGRCLRQVPAEQRRGRFFTDLMAETRTAGLEEGELADRVRRHCRRPRLLGPDLRLLVAGAYRGLLPLLHRLLEQGIPEASLWQVVEALSSLGDPESAAALERALLGPSTSAPLQELARLCVAHLTADLPEAGSAGDGHVLVQTTLNANLQEAGAAAVGGVLTFLHSLGDALGLVPGWRRVVTVEVVPWGAYHPAARLHTPGRGCHEIVKVPVPALRRGESRELMAHELAVRRTIRNTLRLRGIAPDIVHVRYTDNLSKGMLHLADTLSARLVVTLTPDPHRDFCDARGRLQRMSQPETFFYLNKVYLADRLIHRADGLLGIAHGSTNHPLLAYFPKLCLSPEIQRRPVRVIPEGIRTLRRAARSLPRREPEVLGLLSRHPGAYRLEEPYAGLPVMLNVGRLAPGKGQHRLVEAWAESSLRERCLLILVGGHLESPGPEERGVLQAIAAVMARHPELRGRFCHLGAMDNDRVRLLEEGLAAQAAGSGSRPPVYLCSSSKEEFGISILEAMSEGFLVLGPRRGGVATYVEPGVSGFLIDTSSSRSIRAAIERILDSPAYSDDQLRAIARRGREFVEAHFTIDKIAGRFDDFYRLVLAAPRR